MRSQLRSVFISVLLSLLFVTGTYSLQETPDKTALFKEISGNYEFYFDDHYQMARIHINSENELIIERLWDTAKTAKVVDLSVPKFSVYANDATFSLVFERDQSGEIYRCVLESNAGKLTAPKIEKVEMRRSFSKEELLEDLQQMRTAMETMHPALYVFTSKATFDSLFAQAKAKITDKMPLEQFMKITRQLAARIGCGHSSLTPPTAYMRAVPGKLCPLQVRFISEKAYLLKEFGSESFMPVGSEIIAVNNVPMTEIVEEILPYLSADALMRHARMYKLEGFFSTLFSFHYDFPESYRISYRAPGAAEVKECSKDPVPLPVIMMAGMAERRKMFDLNFDVAEDSSYAIMKINSFAFYDNNSRKKFYDFIDTSFKTMKEKKIRNLILDLRRNFGGDPYCSTRLLAHLVPEPFTYYPADYKAYEALTKPIQPAENRFDGKLFTLIDGGSFSSTGHLAAMMKYLKIGTFVGSETAGTYTCNAHTRTIELKHTRCKVTMARRIARVMAEGLPRDRGIMPDREVVAPVDDIITGKDTVLAYAIDLINGQ